MLVLNFVNQVVVGALGATAIAAVGFANSLVFILVLTLGALGASVSILVARAHGSGRRHEMNTSVTAAVLVAGLLAAVTSAPAFLAVGLALLRLTGASPTVAAVGSGYLRLMTLSLVPTVRVRHPQRGDALDRPRPQPDGGDPRHGAAQHLARLLPGVRGGAASRSWAWSAPAGPTLVTAVLKAAILLAQVLLQHRLVQLGAARAPSRSGAACWCRCSCSPSRSASPSCSGPPARSSTTWSSSASATTPSRPRRSPPRSRGSSSSAASG